MEDRLKKYKAKLNKIREERKKLWKENKWKPSKRRVEIVEYEDGTYSLNGYAYYLPLKKSEVKEAFGAWFDGILENGGKK